MEIIPFNDDAQWNQEIELNDISYILSFQWNALNEFWSMNIYNIDLEPIALGIKIVTQWNLTEQIVQEGMPHGDILCQNIIGGFERIGRLDIGQTNELVFYPSES